MRRTLAILLALALALAACGGDDDSGAATSTTSAPTGGEDVDDGGSRGDEALAEAALLTIEDFPAGWRSRPADDDDEDDPIADCGGMNALAERNSGDASSPVFVREDAEIEQGIGLFEDEADAQALVEAFRADETIDCLEAALGEYFEDEVAASPEAAAFDDIRLEAGPLSVGEVGDDRAGYQVVVTVETEGLTIDVFVDLLVVRVGRAVMTLTFLDVLAPLEGPRPELLERAVERLEDVLA